VQHTLRDAAHQLGLGGAERGRGGGLIARCDGFLDAAQVGADARTARLVDWKRASFWRARFLAWGEFAMAFDLSLRVFTT
jgi:hypothetical protein